MFKKIEKWKEQKFEQKMDRYYASKCAELLYIILRELCITVKYQRARNCYEVYIKKPKEEAKYYKLFYRIYFNESLERFVMLKNAKRHDITEDALKMLEGLN